MKFKMKRENGGFTLIEVILSMAILALISLPLLGYFTDSIRYSKLMEQKQYATVMAQETIEKLKAEEVLISEVTLGEGDSATSFYSVPNLLGDNVDPGATPNPNFYTLVNSSLDAEGRGSIKVKRTTATHDVVVTLNTDSGANTVERPIVYSIDDTKDVLAVERDQYSEAIVYFMAVNSAYVSEQNAGLSTEAGGAPAGGTLTVMTREDIERNTTREMFINVTKDAGYFLVKGHYVYTCSGVEGAGTSDTFTSSPLLDVKTKELRSIYLLYDLLAKEPVVAAGAKKEPKTDLLTITHNGVAVGEHPGLVIVCQNAEEYNLDPPYSFQVKSDRDAALNATSIRTNIGTNAIKNSYGLAGDPTKVTNLSESGYPVRIINLEVAVYSAGGYDGGEEPYTVFTSTKGE